jgi:hypothetical protein
VVTTQRAAYQRLSSQVSIFKLHMTVIDFDPALAAELAEREAWHERTRKERIDRAQRLIRSAYPVTVLRTMDVLYPYTTFEGEVRYRKVPELRECRVRR